MGRWRLTTDSQTYQRRKGDVCSTGCIPKAASCTSSDCNGSLGDNETAGQDFDEMVELVTSLFKSSLDLSPPLSLSGQL